MTVRNANLAKKSGSSSARELSAAFFSLDGDLLGSDWDSTGHSKGVLFVSKGVTGPRLFKSISAFAAALCTFPWSLSRNQVLPFLRAITRTGTNLRNLEWSTLRLIC